MGFRFVGGPFNAMEIDHELLNQHALFHLVTGDLGTRLFVFMPNRANWDKIVSGELASPKDSLNGMDLFQTYERAYGPEGPHFNWSPPGAYEQAQIEAKLKVQTRALTAL